MTRLYLARYLPGPDYAHNPFEDPRIDSARVELLAIDGDEREAIVLFASDDLTAHTLAAAGCEVVPALPGQYRDQGSEAIVVVLDETTYTVEEDA